MRLRWAGHVAHMEQSRNAYIVLVGRPEGRRSRRLRRRRADNNKVDLREVNCNPWNGMDLEPMANLCKGGNELRILYY